MDQLLASLPDDKKIILHQFLEYQRQAINRTFDYKSLKCSEWRGYRFIPMFEAETAKRAHDDFEFKENTILLASFAKTGTNWSAEIVRQMLYGDNEELDKASKSFTAVYFMLELWQPGKIDLLEHNPLPRQVLATHLPEELVNFEKIKKKNGKVVVLVRNPKDQAVSWFHFSKNRHFDGVRDELSNDWNQFFSDYVQGKHPLITKPGEWYPEFLLGWYKHRNDSNLMFLTFEDMKRDVKKEIRRLATFLEIELTDERISSIAESTSFENMRKSAQTGTGESAKLYKMLNMVRKGQVGSWKETLTVAQSELIDEIVEEKLGHTDIKFTYTL